MSKYHPFVKESEKLLARAHAQIARYRETGAMIEFVELKAVLDQYKEWFQAGVLNRQETMFINGDFREILSLVFITKRN